MLIFGDDFRPTIMESAFDPLVTPVFWSLNLDAEDFMFSNIGFVEEHDERGCGLLFDGQYVELPQTWYILIGDSSDGTLDLLPVEDIKGREFDAFVFEFNRSMPRTVPMTVFNSRTYQRFCYPIIPKHLMMVHPIDMETGIIITPHDQYNKYIKKKTMMDFLG